MSYDTPYERSEFMRKSGRVASYIWLIFSGMQVSMGGLGLGCFLSLYCSYVGRRYLYNRFVDHLVSNLDVLRSVLRT